MKPFLLWAHRGASAVAPENTLAAFRAAEAAGADGIELDIHLSCDKVPMIIHDATLERTTDGRGPVARRSCRELKRLDAGKWFDPAFAGEPLPELGEVLAWADDRLRVNIEIKSAAAGQAVLATLQAFPRARVLVSSFDHRLLAALRRTAPELPLGFLVDSIFWRQGLARAIRSQAESLHPRADLVSRPLLSACHRHGLAVYPWTVNGEARLRQLLRAGADGIFTDSPGALRNRLAGVQLAGIAGNQGGFF